MTQIPVGSGVVTETVAAVERTVTSVEGDVKAEIEHPSLANLRRLIVDALAVAGLLTFILGVVQSVVPQSRGTVSLILAGIGASTVMMRHAIDVIGS